MKYTIKYLELTHPIEEENDLFEYPNIQMFSDHEELGHKVEITIQEWSPFCGFYINGNLTLEADEANDFYKKLIAKGYRVSKKEVE